MVGYYNRVYNDLEAGKTARASDINLIQSSIEEALTNFAVDMQGPAVIIGSDEDAFTLTPTPDTYDQVNTTVNGDNEWYSMHDRYIRQKIHITKSEINSITVCIKNDSIYDVTLFAEIRDTYDYNLIGEANAKLNKSTAPVGEAIEQEITFTFNLQHIGIGDYYFVIRPISISSLDTYLNGDERGALYSDEITNDTFLIKFDANGTYSHLNEWINEMGNRESGMQYSLDGQNETYTPLYNDELTDIALSDLWFREKFASTNNTYEVSPGRALILGNKVFLLDTHVCIDGPSSLGNRVDLVAMTSNGHLQVIKGHATKGNYEAPHLPNALPIAYVITPQNSSETWTCPVCGEKTSYTHYLCSHCAEGVNTKVPLVLQDDTNDLTRPRDLREEIRRLKKYVNYNEERNAPSRIHYNCIPNPIDNDTNSDVLRNVVPVIQEDGSVIYTTNKSNANQYYWSFKDFDTVQNLPTTGSLCGTAWANCDGCSELEKKQKTITCWKNFCPICSTEGSLKTIESSDDKTKMLIRCVNCNTDFCGRCGKEFYSDLKPEKRSKLTASSVSVLLKNNTIPLSSSGNGDAVPTTTLQYADFRTDVYINGSTYITQVVRGNNITTTSYEIGTSTSNSSNSSSNNSSNTSSSTSNSSNTSSSTNNSTTSTVTSQNIEEKLKAATTVGALKAIIKELTKKAEVTENIDSSAYSSTGDVAYTNKVAGIYNGTTQIDTTSLDGLDINTKDGIVQLKTNKYDDEYQTIGGLDISKRSGQSVQKVFTINNKIESLGQLQSEYPALNFTLDSPLYIKSLKPAVTKFRGMENFQIVLFKNDAVYNPARGHFTVYTKKFKDDATFPNVYESDPVSLKNLTTVESGIQTLQSPHEFEVNQEIPAGNYTLLIYGHPSGDSGDIYLDCYTASNPADAFGSAMTLRGASTPTILYIEPDKVKDYTWDLYINAKRPEMAETGTLYSQTVTTAMPIRAVSVSKTTNIPDGCTIQTYVSNNGGRTYTEIGSQPIRFNGSGTSFKWKMVFKGTGRATPSLKYNPSKGFAILFNLGEAYSDAIYNDWQRRLETRIIDAQWVNANLLGDSHTYKTFGEWEFARLWAEEFDAKLKIDICISYNTDVQIPITYSTSSLKKVFEDQGTQDTVFFSTIFADLTLDDFPQSSVDFSLNDEDVEYDEHNFPMGLESEITYNEEQGIVIATGETLGKQLSDGTTTYDINSHKTLDTRDLSHWTYSSGRDADSNTTMIETGNLYTFAKYAPTDETNKIWVDGNYTNADDTYNSRTIIIGKSFSTGIDVSKYDRLVLDIYPKLYKAVGEDVAKKGETYAENDIYRKIPAGTLQVVCALNDSGSVDEVKVHQGYYCTNCNNSFDGNKNDVTQCPICGYDQTYLEDDADNGNYDYVPNATYGRAYTINQDLYSDVKNEVIIDDIISDIGSFGNLKSIGIRVIGPSSELDIIKQNCIRSLDEIGLGTIKFKGDNIYSLIPADDYYRLRWKGGTEYEGKAGGDELIPYYTSNSVVRNLPEEERPYMCIVNTHPEATTDNTADITNWGQIQFEFGPRAFGDARLEYTSNVSNFNYYYICYFCNQPFDKGEFIAYLCADEDGTEVVEEFTLPAWDYATSSENAWKIMWDNSTKLSPYASPGHSNFVGAWFKRRNYDTNKIKSIVIKRTNINDEPVTEDNVQIKGTYEQNVDGINANNKTLTILTMRGYKTKIVPAFGPKLRMRIYPNNLDDAMTDPVIRKFGVVYTLD